MRSLTPLSFYQVNHGQTELLYDIAEEFAGLNGDELLLDLYCGAGSIGLSMAGKVRKVIGVEIVPEAVTDARVNADLSGIGGVEFICGDAAESAKLLLERGDNPDVVILDPPRSGCDESLIDAVCEMSPSRIVYISCDVATQARDIKLFGTMGYSLTSVKGVDMFPRTAHVEAVALLTKNN